MTWLTGSADFRAKRGASMLSCVGSRCWIKRTPFRCPPARHSTSLQKPRTLLHYHSRTTTDGNKNGDQEKAACAPLLNMARAPVFVPHRGIGASAAGVRGFWRDVECLAGGHRNGVRLDPAPRSDARKHAGSPLGPEIGASCKPGHRRNGCNAQPCICHSAQRQDGHPRWVAETDADGPRRAKKNMPIDYFSSRWRHPAKRRRSG